MAGQEGFADLRPLFPGKTYIGADVREGPGVDRILDLHQIDLPDASVGLVLVIDTLEHVEFPQRAMEEIRRIVWPGGLVVITSVMDFPIHDYPSDYWWFTPDGLRSLLQFLPGSLVEHAGDPMSPHTVVGLGLNGPTPPLGALLPRLKQWQQRHVGTARGETTTGRVVGRRKRRRRGRLPAP